MYFIFVEQEEVRAALQNKMQTRETGAVRPLADGFQIHRETSWKDRFSSISFSTEVERIPFPTPFFHLHYESHAYQYQQQQVLYINSIIVN